MNVSQFFGCSGSYCLSRDIMVALKPSTSPLACGWYSVVGIALRPSSLRSATKNLEVN